MKAYLTEILDVFMYCRKEFLIAILYFMFASFMYQLIASGGDVVESLKSALYTIVIMLLAIVTFIPYLSLLNYLKRRKK